MKKKLNTDLVIGKSDGQPSVLPSFSASWCYSSASRTLADTLKYTNTSAALYDNMSSDRVQSEAERSHLESSSSASNDEDSSTANTTGLDNNHMQEDNGGEPVDEANNVSSPARTPQSLPLNINPNIAMSEDSNVDVESEDQGMPESDMKSREMVSNEKMSSDGNNSMSHVQEVAAMSDAHYIEKQVVESFLSGSSNDLSHSRGYYDRSQGLDKRPSTNGNNNYEKALMTTSSSVTASNNSINSKSAKSLDAILLTIASVAAGEGEPSEYLTRHPEKAREERSPYQPTPNLSHLNRNSELFISG